MSDYVEPTGRVEPAPPTGEVWPLGVREPLAVADLPRPEDVSGPARLLSDPNTTVMTAAVAVFGNHSAPPPILDRIGRIAPTPLFLIYADHGIGGENTRQPKYYEAAGEPKAIWKVAGFKHTAGIKAQPKEYERRVVGFFDRALLD